MIIRNVDQTSIANLIITQRFTWWQQGKSLINRKKSRKVVNNTLSTRLWWLLTFQNSHAGISRLFFFFFYNNIVHKERKPAKNQSANWYAWQTLLITMHYLFHFLNVSNSPTSILSNISVFLRKSHKTILWGIFEKSQIPARDVFEMSLRCHGKDIFFEIC